MRPTVPSTANWSTTPARRADSGVFGGRARILRDGWAWPPSNGCWPEIAKLRRSSAVGRVRRGMLLPCSRSFSNPWGALPGVTVNPDSPTLVGCPSPSRPTGRSRRRPIIEPYRSCRACRPARPRCRARACVSSCGRNRDCHWTRVPCRTSAPANSSCMATGAIRSVAQPAWSGSAWSSWVSIAVAQPIAA